MRISDWSSDVCSSDLIHGQRLDPDAAEPPGIGERGHARGNGQKDKRDDEHADQPHEQFPDTVNRRRPFTPGKPQDRAADQRAQYALPQRYTKPAGEHESDRAAAITPFSGPLDPTRGRWGKGGSVRVDTGGA